MYDEEDLAVIQERREDWEAETLNPVLDAYGERQDQFATDWNLDLDRQYTPEGIA